MPIEAMRLDKDDLIVLEGPKEQGRHSRSGAGFECDELGAAEGLGRSVSVEPDKRWNVEYRPAGPPRRCVAERSR